MLCGQAGRTARRWLDLDTIALITRLLERLDHADPIAGSYHLEVSSPGLERTLRTGPLPRAVGETVAVRTVAGGGTTAGGGGLVVADDDGLTVRDDARSWPRHVAYADIERARTVFVWGPGQAGQGQARS